MNTNDLEQANNSVQKTLKGVRFNVWDAVSILEIGESGIITNKQKDAQAVRSALDYYNGQNSPKYKDFKFTTSTEGLQGCIRVTRVKV